MVVLYIILSIFIILLIWHFTTLKYRNPYKFYFYFGKKGVGKSTFLARIAYENLKKGRTVYSQEVMSFKIRFKPFHKKELVSTLPIQAYYIYNNPFPDGSVILIDEASLLWSNRDFADRRKTDSMRKTIEWFQQQRKHKCIVHMFSVSFDIDKKLRDLCDEMYIVNKVLRVWTVARHVVRKPVIVHPQGDAPASIQDDIIEDGLLLAPFGGMRITFIPKWSKYFDTYREVVAGSTESPSSPLSTIRSGSSSL